MGTLWLLRTPCACMCTYQPIPANLTLHHWLSKTPTSSGAVVSVTGVIVLTQGMNSSEHYTLPLYCVTFSHSVRGGGGEFNQDLKWQANSLSRGTVQASPRTGRRGTASVSAGSYFCSNSTRAWGATSPHPHICFFPGLLFSLGRQVSLRELPFIDRKMIIN